MSENEGTVHVGRVQMTYIETKRFTLNNGRWQRLYLVQKSHTTRLCITTMFAMSIGLIVLTVIYATVQLYMRCITENPLGNGDTLF